MKKFVAGMMAAVLLAGTLAGCGGAKKAKTGFAMVADNNPSHQKEATATDAGAVELTAVAAAALVGEDGKVIKFETDTVQTKFAYNNDGTVTTENNTIYKSKNDLGAEYGMKDASAAAGIGKEWNEQNDAFEQYIIGKTAAEIRAIKVTDGAPADADLASGVTITVTAMIEAAARAVENATDLGATADDKLGFSILSKAQVSEGDLTAYDHFGVVTLDKDGKITSSIIDASQQKAKIEGDKQTVDLTVPVDSKLVLKDKYNMKGASGIGKEWNEQSIAFSDYIKGKTIADVTGLTLTEGAPTGDLASSVTVHVTDWVAVLDAAAKAAK